MAHSIGNSPGRSRGSIVIGLLNCAFLMVTLLSVNVLQSASLLLRPFSKSLFRRSVYGLAAWWWSHFVWAVEELNHFKIIWSGQMPPPGERAMLLGNHQTMVDVPMLLALAKRYDGLSGFKCFAKKSLKYVPGIGWGMWWLDFPFVRRNWEQDKSHVTEVFSTLRTLKGSLWFMSFIEGTRLTPAKLAASQAFAAKQGLTPMKWVMYPRTRGFVAALGAMRDQMDAVYDVTLAYPGGAPSLWEVASHQSRSAHVHVERIPIAQVPADDAALTQWLVERFRKKDRMLEQFSKSGSLTA